MEPGAFQSSSSGSLGLRRLDLSGCRLDRLAPASFRGLEKALESLDLSANRLSDLPEEIFADFDLVRDLRLHDNMLDLSPNITFNGFRWDKVFCVDFCFLLSYWLWINNSSPMGLGCQDGLS